MAIKNLETNEYIKVTSMQFDFAVGNHHITFLQFADQAQRERYETGLSPYEVYKSGQYNGIGHIENALAVLPTNLESTKQAMFNAAYTALKSDIFQNWVDC